MRDAFGLQRKKWIGFLLLAAVLFLYISPAVWADTGPKPSVVIDFVGLEGESYYATLLSEEESTGPWSWGDEHREWEEDEGKMEAFWAFSDYRNEEGFYFIGYLEECSDSQQFVWGYYPPQNFKILLYFPDTKEFLVSDQTCERYAFDSYYKASVGGGDMQVSQEEEMASEAARNRKAQMVVERNYQYGWELVNFAVRVVLTILLELLAAFAFGYRRRWQLGFIMAVNVLTQLFLNLALNFGNYYSGERFFVFLYVCLELVVFGMEAAVYTWKFKKQPETLGHPVCYALTANLLSFFAGMWLTDFIPGIF